MYLHHFASPLSFWLMLAPVPALPGPASGHAPRLRISVLVRIAGTVASTELASPAACASGPPDSLPFLLFLMPLLRNALAWGLALMVFMWLTTALFDGLGLTRSAHHYDTYFGSLSWLQYRVTFRPVGAGRQPAPTGFAPTLRYGFNLAHHVALRADLLQTDVPPADVAPLLYDTLRYPGGFSPDSVYAAWVGVRGHFPHLSVRGAAGGRGAQLPGLGRARHGPALPAAAAAAVAAAALRLGFAAAGGVVC